MANESATGTRERTGTDGPGGPGASTMGPGSSPTSPTNGHGGPEQGGGQPERAVVDPRRRTAFTVVGIIAAIALIIYGFRYYQYSQTHTSTDDAYVTGNLVNVSPIIGGTLSVLNVDEGDSVTKGEILAKLEDSGERAALNQAQEAYKAALSEIPQAQTSLSYQQASTNASIQHAQAALATQQAKTAAAQAQMTLTRETVSNQVDQARQQVAAASAQASQADAQVTSLQAAARSAHQAIQTAQQAASAVTENVAAAQANYDKAHADVLRYQKLLAREAVTQQQYDSVNAAFLTAQASLSAGKDQKNQAGSQVDQAKSNAQQAEAQVLAGTRAAAAAHRQVDVAQAGLALAQANQTQIGIQANNVVSSQTQGTQAQADVASAQAGTQQVTLKRQQIDTLQAQADQAKAALANAQVQEDDTVIAAPSDGMVVRKGINVGAALTPGQTILTMTFGHDVWVTANFKETQMRGIQSGDPAEVEVDAIPGKVFKGRVESVNEATGASTALLPPDNATGNFTKVVQRIPVKIVLVPASSSEGGKYATEHDIANLRQGMSVTATVDVSKR